MICYKAEILNSIGVVHRNRGELAKALECYQDAMAAYAESSNSAGEKAVHVNMGVFYAEICDYKTALNHYERALTITRSMNDKYGEASIYINIGLVYFHTAEYSTALKNLNRALRIFEEIGLATSIVERSIADVYLNQERFEEAYVIYRKLEDPVRLGTYYYRMEDYVNAIKQFVSYLDNL